MAKLLITYDLDGTEKDYPKVWEYLKKLGAKRALESVWLAKTDKTCKAVRDDLKKLIDSDDRLFVCRFDDNWASVNMKNNAGNWLNGNP